MKPHGTTGLNYSGGSGKEVILVWFSVPPQKHINANNCCVFFFFFFLVSCKIAFSEYFPPLYPIAGVEIMAPFSFSGEMQSSVFSALA